MKSGIIEISHQIISILEQIDDASYQKPLPVFEGSTLGQHFRHLIEFMQILSGASTCIDYTARDRNPLLETRTDLAITAIREAVACLSEKDEALQVTVRGDFMGVEPTNRPLLQSSLGRELMFAYDHAVHHLAIIRIGIKSGFPDFFLSETVGVAPSTVRYRMGN